MTSVRTPLFQINKVYRGEIEHYFRGSPLKNFLDSNESGRKSSDKIQIMPAHPLQHFGSYLICNLNYLPKQTRAHPPNTILIPGKSVFHSARTNRHVSLDGEPRPRKSLPIDSSSLSLSHCRARASGSWVSPGMTRPHGRLHLPRPALFPRILAADLGWKIAIGRVGRCAAAAARGRGRGGATFEGKRKPAPATPASSRLATRAPEN